MAKQITFNDTQLRLKIKKLIQLTGKTNSQVVKQHAALTCRDMSYFTPPFQGLKNKVSNFGSAKDKKQGERSTTADLYKAMRPIGAHNKWRDKRIGKLIKKKDIPALEAIFKHITGPLSGYQVREFDKALHKDKRNKRGRIAKNQRVISVPNSEHKKYLKTLLTRVGRAKAASAELAVKLGVKKKPPKWISRHFGKVDNMLNDRSRDKKKPQVKVRVSEPGVNHVLRRMRFISRTRVKAMAKQLEAEYRAQIRKAKLHART